MRRPSRPCSGRGASGSVVSHFGPADGAEQDRVGGAAGLEHLVGERGAVRRRSSSRRSGARRTRTRPAPRAARRAAATISGPIPSPGRTTMRGRAHRRGTLRVGAGDGLDVEADVVEPAARSSSAEDVVDEAARAAPPAGASRCGPRQTVRRNSARLGRRDRPTAPASSATSVEPGARAGAPRSPRRRRSSRARRQPSKCGANGLARRDLGDRLARGRRCCPRRRTGPPAGRRAAAPRAGGSKSASWSRIQWKAALEKTASTCSSSSSSSRSATSALVARSPSALARLLDHRRGAVDGDHAALGQALEQHPR